MSYRQNALAALDSISAMDSGSCIGVMMETDIRAVCKAVEHGQTEGYNTCMTPAVQLKWAFCRQHRHVDEEKAVSASAIVTSPI